MIAISSHTTHTGEIIISSAGIGIGLGTGMAVGQPVLGLIIGLGGGFALGLLMRKRVTDASKTPIETT